MTRQELRAVVVMVLVTGAVIGVCALFALLFLGNGVSTILTHVSPRPS
jgi:hypothetical protein